MGYYMINNLSKKENQRNAGTKARQDGENVKNDLSRALAYDHNAKNINSQIKILLNHLNINENDIRFIHTKSHSDGKISCAKSDIRINIEFNNGIKIPHQISLKSTFAKTQVSVHSVNSFEKNLDKKKIAFPTEVKEFLNFFTNSKIYQNKPDFIFDESNRRHRFSLDEINCFDSQLFIKTQSFFEEHAEKILEFLISSGSEEKKENFANLLAFCDKNLNNLIFVNIKKLIDCAIKTSKDNDVFCVANKGRKKTGITTLSLYGGLIQLQMKGSGEGSAYHNLQFNISGKFIKKWIEDGLLK